MVRYKIKYYVQIWSSEKLGMNTLGALDRLLLQQIKQSHPSCLYRSDRCFVSLVPLPA